MAPEADFLAAHWKAVARGLDASGPAALTDSARRAYSLACLPTALLGAALGLLGLWLQPDLLRPGWGVAAALLGTGAVLPALTFWLGRRQLGRELNRALGAEAEGRRQEPQRLQRRAVLAAGFGLAAAPGIPWLLACAALSWPALALALVALAAAAYVAGWQQLGRWARLVWDTP